MNAREFRVQREVNRNLWLGNLLQTVVVLVFVTILGVSF
jgi:hypothetical protein